MSEPTVPNELAAVEWKLEHGFDTIPASAVAAIVAWAKSLADENRVLRAADESRAPAPVATKKKKQGVS